MNYKIIVNEEELKEFIDWLPDLEPHEKYYLCLFARNKYCRQLTHIKSDKAQLKRFVSDKERMFFKIKQLEVSLESYRQKDIPVPQEALALYITPNPRHMFKASINTMVKIAQSIRDTNVEMNPHQEALSEIQKSKSRTCYIDFDVDYPTDLSPLAIVELEDDIISSLSTYVNTDAITLIKTRGGLHILVDPKKVDQKYKNTFYKNLSAISDQTGDQVIPIPGTYQGGFVPRFINLDSILKTCEAVKSKI